jgi:hypothetical protein
MPYKKKEKPLTAEEAIDLAKKELAPFWIGIPPMFAATVVNGKATAFPLDPEMMKHRWIFIFLDPTTFSGDASLLFIKEFYKRYQEHSLKMLLVLKKCQTYFKASAYLTQWLKKTQIPLPLAYDSDGALSDAFQADPLPKVSIYLQGRAVFQASGSKCFLETENEIQRFLRNDDPGLPLFPAFKPKVQTLSDSGVFDFGTGAASSRKPIFREPGFKPLPNGTLAGIFPGLGKTSIALKKAEVALKGTWIQDAERIATQDPTATLSIQLQGSYVSLNAQGLATEAKSARVYVEFNESSALDVNAGEALAYDEEGKSLVRIEGGGIYQILKNLPDPTKVLTLRFPYADRVPVALFGIRFGTPNQ